MDNIGFVIDENLPVVGHALAHGEEYAVVYQSGSKLGKLENSCHLSVTGLPEEILVPVYGAPTQKEVTASIMPALSMEETALLGMDDVELKNIQLQFPSSLRLSNSGGATEQRVRTDRGDLVVAVQGDRAKPAIITYHDLGVNYVCFQPFFNYVDMRALAENFCVFHVNAPGQEDGAPTLPEDYTYPTMDEMANQINYVMAHFGLKTFIGFGVGAGAHVLAKFAISNPDKVDALALINCSSSQAGWIEWAYQKMNTRALRSRGMTQAVLDYLMWHHFGRAAEERNPDLAAMYRMHFSRNVNPANLAHYIDAYTRRGDLGISRDGATIRPPVLNVTGAMSPHVDDTVTFNSRLNPNNSTWMKIQDCGLVLDEQPSKISEAFRLFLQGEGYGTIILALTGVVTIHDVNTIEQQLVAPLSPSKITEYRRVSEAGERRRVCRLSPVIHITENPISEAVAC